MNNANTLHPGQILNDQFLIPKQISIGRAWERAPERVCLSLTAMG